MRHCTSEGGEAVFLLHHMREYVSVYTEWWVRTHYQHKLPVNTLTYSLETQMGALKGSRDYLKYFEQARLTGPTGRSGLQRDIVLEMC